MNCTTRFDRLAAALFDGEHKVVDIIVVGGTDPSLDRERLSEALYASMQRMGLIVDGRMQPAVGSASR